MSQIEIRRLALVGVILLSLSPAASAGDRQLRTEFVVKAPLQEAWKAWTTSQGLESFFAPHCRIDPRVDGELEIWFTPDAPPGQRGAEGQMVMQVLEGKRLAFTWNAPPTIPTLRDQKTLVTIDFEPLGAGLTRIRFAHLGWGRGEDWDQALEYFDGAWRIVVLPRFKHALEAGPIQPGKTPQLPPISDSLLVRD